MLFITATGTDLGKTYVTQMLIRQLRDKGEPVLALKPVASGFTDDDPASDTALIAKAQDFPLAPETLDRLSPWRFTAPLSPHLAAKKERRAIDPQQLMAFCRNHDSPLHHLLIEGAGGVMTPLTPQYTTLDWIKALHCPALLITGCYLGAISHTLTAMRALESETIPLQGIIVNAPANAEGLEDTAESLRQFTSAPVMTLQKNETPSLLPFILPCERKRSA